jgi:hypothetical protein
MQPQYHIGTAMPVEKARADVIPVTVSRWTSRGA